jgi:hypothetical protein
VIRPDYDARPLIQAILLKAIEDATTGAAFTRQRKNRTKIFMRQLDAWLFLEREGALWAEAAGLDMLQEPIQAIRERGAVIRTMLHMYKHRELIRKSFQNRRGTNANN